MIEPTIKDEPELIELATDVLTNIVIAKSAMDKSHMELCQGCTKAFKRLLAEEQIIRSFLSRKGYDHQYMMEKVPR